MAFLLLQFDYNHSKYSKRGGSNAIKIRGCQTDCVQTWCRF